MAFVKDPGVFWREMGLRWQVASGPLLKMLGFRIIRAQHRQDEAPRPVLHKTLELDDYLWKYADYIVQKEGAVSLLEVKAKPYIPLKLGGQVHTFRDRDVSFTEKQKEAFPDATVPVLILLIHYCDRVRRRDLLRVDPVYYAVVPFKDFQFMPNWGSGILPKDPEELMKRLRNGEASRLLRRVKRAELSRLTP